MLFELMHDVPDAVVLELRGNEARRAIALFNPLPKQRSDSADRFYIALRPGFPFSRLMIARHGCIEDDALVDVRVAIAIKRAVRRFDVARSF